MRFDRDVRRKLFSHAMAIACLACVAIAILPLGDILYTSAVNGLKVLSFQFFTQNSPIPCDPRFQTGCSFGGIYNSIQGTLLLIVIAAGIALPVGILCGIYLSEFGANPLGNAARFFADVLAGVPSIVMGVVVFSLFLLLFQDGYITSDYVLSVLSASIALAFIMLPIVARTAEEALRLVPTTTREAALALGIPRYRVVLRIVLRSARSAVITGGLLAVARAAGETAPLIILNPGNLFPFAPALGLHQTTASLPISIYRWIVSPYPNWQADAWGATFVLVILMLGISVAARLALRERFGAALR
ncbi:MAG: phosphate ABC transporter permease PstA [Thermoplasmata archaeon]|nr:phosphate ABC transporter permease PstA [Thermoplasmata archaeon]